MDQDRNNDCVEDTEQHAKPSLKHLPTLANKNKTCYSPNFDQSYIYALAVGLR